MRKENLLGFYAGKIEYVFEKYLSSLYPINPPSFMIVGAQKAGTGSLHYYLNQHPQLKGTKPKELHFFDRKQFLGHDFSDYLVNFRGNANKKYFESTPIYMYLPHVVPQIHEAFPDIKLIVVLRNPVERAFSAWNHYRVKFEKGGHNNMAKSQQMPWDYIYEYFYRGRSKMPSFRECIDIELRMIEEGKGFEPAILRRGLYLEQLERIWSYYPADNVKIVGFNDLTQNTIDTLNEICKFIGVDSIEWKYLNSQPRNSHGYTEKLSSDDRAFLESFYFEGNEKLFKKIGPVNW